jgi:hypothetical protein
MMGDVQRKVRKVCLRTLRYVLFYVKCIYCTYTLCTFFVNTYKQTYTYNTNSHVYAHKCLYCAGIEPATSRVVDEYATFYAKSVVKRLRISNKYGVT